MITLNAVNPIFGLSPEEAAAYWIVRMDRDDVSSSEEGQFEAWLIESPANATAYERAEGAWSLFDVATEHPQLAALRQSALASAPAPRHRRWWGGAAASIAACTVATLLYFAPYSPVEGDRSPFSHSQGSDPTTLASAEPIVTAKGERKVLKLPDGSTVTLNTDSAITVEYTQDLRRIRLSRGQALFQVAKDAERRFVVEAANRQIVALGTEFDVRVDPGRIRLLLVEGKVSVGQALQSSEPGKPPTVILKAGQELIAEGRSPQQVRNADFKNQLRWVDGYVEFDDEPLGRAVAEVNRYTDRPIVIVDDKVASLRLSGVFRTGDPDRFAAIVSELLPVTTQPATSGGVEIRSRDGR